MTPQEIQSYIKAASQNKSKEEIYTYLFQQGCKLPEIEAGFQSTDEPQEVGKKTIKVLVLIGALLIGAGIFSFIAANWQEMSRPLKIGTIMVSMLCAHALGWFFSESRGLDKVGEALIFLGTLIYGAGIFLIAQMYQTRAIWPDGFILWLFGAVAMGFAIESTTTLGLSLFLAFAALCGYPSQILNFGSQGQFLQTSSLLLVAATIITFWAGSLMHKKIPDQYKDL
jgi:uncharacterized membrane protein